LASSLVSLSASVSFHKALSSCSVIVRTFFLASTYLADHITELSTSFSAFDSSSLNLAIDHAVNSASFLVFDHQVVFTGHVVSLFAFFSNSKGLNFAGLVIHKSATFLCAMFHFACVINHDTHGIF
jgi:hypothetical protein